MEHCLETRSLWQYLFLNAHVNHLHIELLSLEVPRAPSPTAPPLATSAPGLPAEALRRRPAKRLRTSVQAAGRDRVRVGVGRLGLTSWDAHGSSCSFCVADVNGKKTGPTYNMCWISPEGLSDIVRTIMLPTCYRH